MGLLDGALDTAVSGGEAVLDVPADAVNATTGTGNNLGWFGKIDRALDPRNIDDDEWADPSGATTGASGFFDGAIGATTSLGREVGSVTADPVLAFVGLGGQPQRGAQDPEQQGPAQIPPGTILLLLAAVAALIWVI